MNHAEASGRLGMHLKVSGSYKGILAEILESPKGRYVQRSALMHDASGYSGTWVHFDRDRILKLRPSLYWLSIHPSIRSLFCYQLPPISR